MTGHEWFRRRPIVVEAHRWTRNDNDEPGSFGNDHMAQWLGPSFLFVIDADHLMLKTLEGPIGARLGDWIIRGVAGEFYPCKPGIFAATYAKRTVPGPHGRHDVIACHMLATKRLSEIAAYRGALESAEERIARLEATIRLLERDRA